MKSKFATIDIIAVVHDLKQLCGMRVVNVYDIDSKTYLIKLHKPSDKAFILFESGVRIHTTTHEWPKSQVPSGFSMKFRKHINQKRLVSVNQIGADRIIDMQFGDEDRACHVIVELYDRGNVILTDSDYWILNVLRPRTDHDHDVRFGVKEKYPLDLARKENFLPSMENIMLFLESAKPDDYIRKALVRHVPFSGQLLEHGFIESGLPANAQIKDLPNKQEGALAIRKALLAADNLMKSIQNSPSKGYITYNLVNQQGKDVETYQEYHPTSFAQFHLPNATIKLKEFPCFSEAVDDFYSRIDSQKLQQRALLVENEAIKKLNNVKKDHERRVKALDEVQESQQRRAELIEMNRKLVDECITFVRRAIANKMPWEEISKFIQAAAAHGFPAAKSIVRLNLSANTIVLRLFDIYENIEDDDEDSEDEKKSQNQQKKGSEVEIDLDLNAAQNGRKYFSDRKAAVVKQHKTLQASKVALKNAQRQAQNKVEQVRTNISVVRTRKAMWFEKFFWCISTENYLIIGGRDAQQNEMLVKRYLRPGDVYVHADLHGASSVVVRNKNPEAEIPPLTLNEAGSMAVCYSSAWEAKILVSAWWVYHHQVSRTAQTGEYLPTGSFMIRGKKNYLPSVHLQLGFGLLFRIDEEATQRHLAERQSKLSSLAASENASTIDQQPETADVANIEEVDEELKEEDNEEDGGAEEGEDEFPDVQVNLDSLRMSTQNDGDEEYTMIQFSQPVNKRDDERRKYLDSKNEELKKAEEKELKKAQKKNAPLTKRQKHKLDKIRKKYADQDEEEREIRMRLMGTQASSVLNKLRSAMDADQPTQSEETPEAEEETSELKEEKAEEIKEEEKVEYEEEAKEGDQQEEEEEEPEDRLEQMDTEESILSSLISQPHPDDGILFVVPVCGPYSAIQKYKYKVKITPGTGKRGKAVKMAFALFQKDKSATNAERNLVKALASDPAAAQTLPAKVRVSAPQLLNMKKK